VRADLKVEANTDPIEMAQNVNNIYACTNNDLSNTNVNECKRKKVVDKKSKVKGKDVQNPRLTVRPSQSLGKEPELVLKTQRRDSDSSGSERMSSSEDDDYDSYTIDLTPKNTVLGTLKNKREAIILIDSGATESIISQSFLDNNLTIKEKDAEIIDPPSRLCIANGEFILAKQ
jgi:hypothetical protein